jgi:uncharacterized LabA/DUF88 family protein
MNESSNRRGESPKQQNSEGQERASTSRGKSGTQAKASVAAKANAGANATQSSGSNAKQKNLLFQKVAIFVDAENIEMSSLKHHEGRTDYKKILDQVGDREIIRVLYYKPAYKEISAEFESFWASLGGEIRRPTKNADTFLVIDAVTMAEKIDVAIILGGDKDFLPLIWYLRSRGCRVEIWSWPETTSPEMKEGSDFYFPLTEDFVMSKPKPRR